MSTATLPYGSRTSLTTSALDSLASATYVSAGTIAHTTNDPLACKIEVKVTPGTVSSSKRVVVFAQASLDGTNFESGPTSGTTTTDEPNLRYIGEVPCLSNSTAQTRIFDLGGAYPDGTLPYATKIIVKNETGAALAASGHHVYYAEGNGNIA